MLKLLLGTRKGAWILSADSKRQQWKLSRPILFGHVVHHFVQDPRDPKRLVIAAKAGHLGPSVFTSFDRGKTWKEAAQPPAFAKAADGEKGRVVDHVFFLAPGHASEPGVWYAGTSPQGLFRSSDHGVTWQSVDGFNLHPENANWCGRSEDAPPEGARLHSINIDPRDANHLYIGMSSGGVFESTDRGQSWRPLNRGCYAEFLPTPEAEYGHDPHCVVVHPAQPDRLYQQNHCGIYRLDRPEDRWTRIGDNMPKSVGDIGFGIVVHPRNPDRAWVFPMDGTSVWPRTAVDGKPALYTTINGGKRWLRQDKGLPKSNAWWTVFRQAMASDGQSPLGLYFGTTNGEIWGSRNEGDSWKCLVSHLPRIHSVEAAQ